MENVKHNTLSESANDILGQFYCAFGQGAGSIRIQRSTIAALRARYAGPIAGAIAEWDTAAPQVLAFMAQVGRLAALLATQAGRTAISASDFTAARRAVEAGVHQTAENAGKLFAGPFCPPVAGEQPEPARPEANDLGEPVNVVTPSIGALAARTH